jgi:hypothetical protein
MKLPRLSSHLLLRISAVATLFALALMVWSVLVPDVIPIMVAMTVGQGLGTLAFAAYGYVVVRDLMYKRAERRSLRSQDLTKIARELVPNRPTDPPPVREQPAKAPVRESPAREQSAGEAADAPAADPPAPEPADPPAREQAIDPPPAREAADAPASSSPPEDAT